MSRLGVFQIPGEFKSEDKWFRYFNRKQAIVLVICGIIDYRVVMSASSKGLLVPALIAMILFTLIIMGSVMIHLPVDVMFLTGGGLTMDEMLVRLLYRRINRCIYTKNYDEKYAGDL